MTYDGTNFYTADIGTSKIYQHDGFSGVILNEINTAAPNQRGLTHDGTDLYSSSSTSDLIYHHNGFSTTILGSIAGASLNPFGLAWENFNNRINIPSTAISLVCSVAYNNIASYLNVGINSIAKIDGVV